MNADRILDLAVTAIDACCVLALSDADSPQRLLLTWMATEDAFALRKKYRRFTGHNVVAADQVSHLKRCDRNASPYGPVDASRNGRLSTENLLTEYTAKCEELRVLRC